MSLSIHIVHGFLAAVVTSVGVGSWSVLVMERKGRIDSVVGEIWLRAVLAVTRARRHASIATDLMEKCMMLVLVIAGFLLRSWSDGVTRMEAGYGDR